MHYKSLFAVILLLCGGVLFSQTSPYSPDNCVIYTTGGPPSTDQNLNPPDSLALGILFIQFADWETDLSSRGSV